MTEQKSSKRRRTTMSFEQVLHEIESYHASDFEKILRLISSDRVENDIHDRLFPSNNRNLLFAIVENFPSCRDDGEVSESKWNALQSLIRLCVSKNANQLVLDIQGDMFRSIIPGLMYNEPARSSLRSDTVILRGYKTVEELQLTLLHYLLLFDMMSIDTARFVFMTLRRSNIEWYKELDVFNNTFLHAVVFYDTGMPAAKVDELLFIIAHAGGSLRLPVLVNGRGETIVHLVAMRFGLSDAVIVDVLKLCPAARAVRDYRGYLPLHYLYFEKAVSGSQFM